MKLMILSWQTIVAAFVLAVGLRLLANAVFESGTLPYRVLMANGAAFGFVGIYLAGGWLWRRGKRRFGRSDSGVLRE